MPKSTSIHLLYSTHNILRNPLCYFTKHIIITKRPISASLTTPKPLIVWITTNWKILKRDGDTVPPDLPPEKYSCKSRSNN